MKIDELKLFGRIETEEKPELGFMSTLSPFEEMVAYETIWAMPGNSLKSIANMFRENPVLPSQILERIDDQSLLALREHVRDYLKTKKNFSICVNETFQYPEKLREARYPLELFYYKGDIDLLNNRLISVVGSRKCTIDGQQRAAKIVKGLIERGFVIVSGLALGIDTAALQTAIACGGKVVGVIGTPIDKYYPKQNIDLQNVIAKSHLLISQVPFYLYERTNFLSRRNFFPQRNETMSALSEATIIIEASDTSGTLTQARAALSQRRKLFILNSCFENPNISWPRKFEKTSAIRVREFEDIFKELES